MDRVVHDGEVRRRKVHLPAQLVLLDEHAVADPRPREVPEAGGADRTAPDDDTHVRAHRLDSFQHARAGRRADPAAKYPGLGRIR
ncbi:MAG: hypothetical protein OXU81_01605, partial [Gammaproteobacteria bacterium]|nr:hypothetical protein [Gammaproteobacteria bacterium]